MEQSTTKPVGQTGSGQAGSGQTGSGQVGSAKVGSELAGSAPATAPGAVQRAASAENAVLPAVDIFENEIAVTIMADMPGVSRDRLGVRIDGDTLVIEGAAMPKDAASQAPAMEIIYGEVLSPLFRRSFTLSRDLDPDKIVASLNNGVLKLVIPKSEQARPRRIQVKID